MSTLALLVNLGTPDAPNSKAVKKYLAQFLSDPRVVEIPQWLWQPILRGLVLTTRPKKSAEAYQSIWREDGSPLMVLTKALATKVQNELTTLQVDVAMRYGNPGIPAVLKKWQQKVSKIIAIPLYPQYASSSTGSALDAIMQELQQWRYIPSVIMLSDYHDHLLYIQALAQQISQHWQKHSRGEKLLISYHGITQRSVNLGDPYYQQCQRTTQLLAQALDLQPQQYQMVFQSRFGRAKWLEPACDETLINLAKTGITQVDIVCPGFAVDCLETLEEIALRYREIFIAAGGKQYQYIPCLNDSSAQVTLIKELICANIA